MRGKKSQEKVNSCWSWVVLLVLDVLSKAWFAAKGSYVGNRGVFFGWQVLSDEWWGVVSLLLGWWWFRLGNERRVGERLVIVGGFGNILDRWVYGEVVDWLPLLASRLWVNLADLYISVGVGIILLDYLLSLKVKKDENSRVVRG